MPRKTLSRTFVEHFQQQLASLRTPGSDYQALHVYVAGVRDPWEFGADGEFEFHCTTGVVVVRDGPGEDGNRRALVPEYVFRLDAIVATQLV